MLSVKYTIVEVTVVTSLIEKNRACYGNWYRIVSVVKRKYWTEKCLFATAKCTFVHENTFLLERKSLTFGNRSNNPLSDAFSIIIMFPILSTIT